MERFDDFIKERIYLTGVSNATIEWYKGGWPGTATATVNPNNSFIAMRQAMAYKTKPEAIGVRRVCS